MSAAFVAIADIDDREEGLPLLAQTPAVRFFASL